jgi:hypothetical protein
VGRVLRDHLKKELAKIRESCGQSGGKILRSLAGDRLGVCYGLPALVGIKRGIGAIQ